MGIRWSWPRPSWTRRVSTAVPTTPRTGCGWAAPRASHATTAPYTDPHKVPKEMFVRPLRADARARLADPVDRPEWVLSRDAGDVLAPGVTLATGVVRGAAGLPPRPRQEAQAGDSAGHLRPGADCRGCVGPAATERFAKLLDQEALRALGAWRNPTEGRWVAPSDSTICRVVADTDPDALAAVLGKWAAPRFAGTAAIPALAADGKRIRGVNRHTNEDTHFETVTLVSHAGHPLASRCCRDEGGEVAATRALLEDVDVRGCLITLDALHTTRDNERTIIETARRRLSACRQGQLPRDVRGAHHPRLERRGRPASRRRTGAGSWAHRRATH